MRDFTINLSKIHFTKRNADNKYIIVETRDFGSFDMNSNNTTRRTLSWDDGFYRFDVYSLTKTFTGVSNEVTGFWFEGECKSNITENPSKQNSNVIEATVIEKYENKSTSTSLFSYG